MLRDVQRAAAELRRGAAVLLELELGPSLVLLAAETAEWTGLEELRAAAFGRPVLLLARRRAADLLQAEPPPGDPVMAFDLPDARLEPSFLHALADPVRLQPAPEAALSWLSPMPMPQGAEAAIRLAKIARLLPALLVAHAPPEVAADTLLRVRDTAIRAYPQALSVGLRQVAEAAVPLNGAPDARMLAFRPLDGGAEHLAIVVGQPQTRDAPLVRLHSACLTGDVLGSLRCDCGPQLQAALARMSADGAGVLLYLAQEGRGIGIVNKLRAYAIQDRGQDTVDANLSLGWDIDERSFLPAAIMLEHLGLRRVRLMTNNPAKVASLRAHGIDVAAREPSLTPANGVNDAYLHAKATRLGHLL
jgi:GTP cyclohydrolase II